MNNLTTQINALQQEGIISQQGIMERLLDTLQTASRETLLDHLATTLPGYILTIQANNRHIARTRMRNATTKHPTTSRRVAEIRTAWQQKLDTIIYLPTSGAKQLRDCVKQDLLEYAASLRQQANSLNASANEYENYARQLPDNTTPLGNINPTTMTKAA